MKKDSQPKPMYYVHVDLSMVSPGATRLELYRGTSQRQAQLSIEEPLRWVSALNLHGPWMTVITTHNYPGQGSYETGRSWTISWSGKVNEHNVRPHFLLMKNGEPWANGGMTLGAIKHTFPPSWFDGYTSNDHHWLRLQREKAAATK
jgi:hypothetical protein